MNIPFSVKKELGSGTFGSTHLIDYNGKDAVLKWPRINSRILEEEAERMKKLHSRYCVHIIDVVKKDGITGIVMEYCPHRSLKDVLDKIKSEKKMLSKEGILKLFCEIVLGLKYLHDHNILHLDLKPANIFITRDNMCVLGDFGLSKEVEDLEESLKGLRGTLIYNAPEKMEECGSYHAASDIYSLGLILYEMCTLERFINQAKETKDILEMEKEDNPIYISQMEKIPSYIPREIRGIIRACLKYDPDERPSIENIYQTTIIENYIEKGIKDFYYTNDATANIKLRNCWREIIDLGEDDEFHQIKDKKDIIFYLFNYYNCYTYVNMSDDEIINMWQLIQCISREIGFQLLLNPYSRYKKVKYYKTEEYHSRKYSRDRSNFINDMFPNILKYLYLHKYNEEAEIILSNLSEEDISDDIKDNLLKIKKKYS